MGTINKRVRLGMVGGGEGAFIGAVHRMAARIDDQFELVAGALSSDPTRADASAKGLGIAPDRSYATFEQMALAESKRSDGIEAVSIVTPNHLHFAVAKTFLEAGINVICDKPLTSTLNDAIALGEVAKNTDAAFILTHNYSGYPMVRQAREWVRTGEIGKIRRVQVEYAQDWLTAPIDLATHKQASWRADPQQAGAGGAIADIGTHAFQLSQFICGEPVLEISAELTRFVEGRMVDDDAHIMIRYQNGAKGCLWASQVAPGNENALRIRVFGDRGSIEWHQENPNQLWVAKFGAPKYLLTRGGPGTTPIANDATRVPAGHPEGYLEGFATIYKEAAEIIRHGRTANSLVPTIDEGILGMRFIDAAVRSSNTNAAWISLEE